METDDLIDQIAANATPVRPLPPPEVRAALWLAVTVPYISLVVVAMSPRADLVELLAQPRFLIELTAALATGIFAALAAFECTVPGRSRMICLLPLAPVAVWFVSLGRNCAQDWLAYGADGLKLRMDWDCMPAAALAGIPPAIAMVALLRRGAPLFPSATLAMGGLAVGALANAGLQLFHAGEASLMVLFWHLGSVAMFAALAGWAGRRILRWPDPFRILRRNRMA